MIESWKFINGERIMFPMSSDDARQLNWHRVETSSYYDYNEVNNWLKEHIQDRAYWVGFHYTFFYREADATLFRLRWA